MRKQFFPAKILLFGEYGVMENSVGISIPHNSYTGSLEFHTKFNTKILYSNYEIKKYYNFLSILEKKRRNLIKLNLRKLHEDLQKGIFFHSNIPQGYGIGSSGALVAAIYDRYAKKKLEKCLKHAIILKEIFSKMESFFHGKSSGIDPLTCYLNIPLLIHSKTDITEIKFAKNNNKNKGTIFLLNSGFPGKTSSMARFFIEKLKNPKFRKILKNEFIIYNEKCVESFLKKDFEFLLKNVKILSTWIFNNLRPMIPKKLWKIWEEGILNNRYYLKLCGSGGGGFILGFTKNYEISKNKLKKYTTKVVFHF
ncbi:mevalonate kinase family protein [Blattabacterium cuenoti]|uniref:mevalonate kinase family protein n=1 Tax=Blattabacterium cuenoti TaxID=1653831 RepID=UPI00163C1A53|nr:mevalonate kinase [Blattabacterium cuenoti]